MLGRKQSIKGEPVLADYGPEESLNESADIEWVNKVGSLLYDASQHRLRNNPAHVRKGEVVNLQHLHAPLILSVLVPLCIVAISYG